MAAQETAAAGTATPPEEEPSERRKLFVGGVPSMATEADLRNHFAGFGEVVSAVLMRHRDTGHGRGFGFVEFADEDAAAKALGDGDKPRHCICGRQVDVKRARTRQQRNLDHTRPQDNNVNYESKKIFIGGLRDNITEQEFKSYFETFGKVTDVAVIYDSLTHRSRGFGFVTFDSEEAVNKVMRQSFHNLNGTKVEAKIAIPKDEHYYRNGRGRGGRSFGPRGPLHLEGSVYQQPYDARYGFYSGYMPHSVPVHSVYHAPYFAVGGYHYGMRVPPVYGAYPHMYPGVNIVSQVGFGDAAHSLQYGFSDGSDKKKDADMQDVSIAAKLEHLNLGSQQ